MSLALSVAQAQSCPAAKDLDKKGDTIPLCLVAGELTKALVAYGNDPASKALPKLSKVTFDFKTEVDTTVAVKVSFLIFKFGGSRQTATTNDVTFTYAVPPPKFGISANKSGKAQPMAQVLVGLLQAAAREITQTPTVSSAKFQSLAVSLAYGVKWDVNAEGDPVVSIVTLGGNVDRSKNDVQSMTVTFAP